jgi:dephospho-CoA kinase
MSDSARIIGLTGGIGMGKTTVSRHLAETYHLPILDADVYAREAVQPGSPILVQIVDRYGTSILQADGNLDRRRLGEIVFQNPRERTWLEQQIHPYVREHMQADSQRFLETQRTIVMVIPLLFEANLTHLVTEIWVVACSTDQQIQRLIQRENLTSDQAQARIQSQMPIEEKCRRATIVLDNSSSLEALLQQVDRALLGTNRKLTTPYTRPLD